MVNKKIKLEIHWMLKRTMELKSEITEEVFIQNNSRLETLGDMARKFKDWPEIIYVSVCSKCWAMHK